jgi:short-subunit dehydrogenase
VAGMRIGGRVALVTGASSGIGAAIAVELARRGAIVGAVARREDRLADVIDRCRGGSPRSIALPGDVADPQACDRVVAELQDHAGPISILVNNAGISPAEDPVHRTFADMDRILAVNLLPPVRLAGALLPGMVQRGAGSVINVTSVSGQVPNPGEPAYGASKAALARWSHGLAVELAGTGVHVGVLSPGPIDTEIWGDTGTHYSGRLYPPEQVARAAARMIERGQVQVTVPRRFGAPGAMYPLVGRPMRWGLRKFGDRASSSG